MMEPYVKEACRDIDEALQADDVMYDKEAIEEFMRYLDFWMAEAKKIKELVDGRSRDS